MGGWTDKVKAQVDKVVNLLMPLPDAEEEALDEALKAESRKQEQREDAYAGLGQKVVNGAPLVYADSEPETKIFGKKDRTEAERPKLTLHTTKVAKLTVKIYAPSNFDQVTAIADDLKAGKATVVNYERVALEEQRRICDFVNGVCYTLDGCAKRITGQIVLYVPDGVDVDEALSVAMPE